MFVKNFLKPGDYLMPVPLGLPLTIEYDYDGKLAKCYSGWQGDKIKLDDTFTTHFKSAGYCPNRINVKGGRTEIVGVLYNTEFDLFNEGNLPECIEASISNKITAHPDKFKFFAGNIDSMATIFRGANPIVNWLNMNGFTALPGFIVPAHFSKSDMIKMMNTERFYKEYNSSVISNYLIYRGGNLISTKTNIKQYVTSKVKTYLNEYGYVKSAIYSKGEKDPVVTLDYSDVVHYNVQTNTLIVLDADHQIVYTTNTDNKKRDKRSKTMHCSICGKLFDVPEHGIVMCLDKHCKSKWLPQINRILNAFRLPEMTQSRFDDVVSGLVQISDIFELDEYKDCKINGSLSDILIALIPSTTSQNLKTINKLAAKCKNTVKPFLYYINNPRMIAYDLDVDPLECKGLINWLSDTYNQQDVESLIDLPQMTITAQGKYFDGPPIFRNKSILLTGSFRHGTIDDIKSILKSYSADVVYDLSPNINCILIGDILENIDSKAIRYCKSNNIPVMTETQFFTQYQIDEDLAENLV